MALHRSSSNKAVAKKEAIAQPNVINIQGPPITLNHNSSVASSLMGFDRKPVITGPYREPVNQAVPGKMPEAHAVRKILKRME